MGARLRAGVAAVFVLVACSPQAITSPSPESSAMAHFDDGTLRFSYPETWTVEDSFAVDETMWACADGSWHATLGFGEDGRVDVDRCVMLGSGRADPDAILESIQDTGTVDVTTSERDGFTQIMAKSPWEGHPGGSLVSYTLIPGSQSVSYTVGCSLPGGDAGVCEQVASSLVMPERDEPIPDYVTQDLTRFAYSVRSYTKEAVEAEITYRGSDGTMLTVTESLPWSSGLLQAPATAVVELRADVVSGPAKAALSCGLATDRSAMGGTEAGASGTGTCSIGPETIEGATSFDMPAMPSPEPVVREDLEGTATVAMTGDQKARFTMTVEAASAELPSYVDADALQITWVGDGPSGLELAIDPAHVGAFDSTPVEYPAEPPSAFFMFTSSPWPVTIIQPDRKGACTITIETIDEDNVEGRFVCPRLDLVRGRERTVRLTGTFEAHASA